MRTLLKGARLLDPASGLDEVGDLLLEDGRIAARGGDLDPKDCQVEDCRGWVAAPGLVDMHVHLPDPQGGPVFRLPGRCGGRRHQPAGHAQHQPPHGRPQSGEGPAGTGPAG